MAGLLLEKARGLSNASAILERLAATEHSAKNAVLRELGMSDADFDEACWAVNCGMASASSKFLASPVGEGTTTGE